MRIKKERTNSENKSKHRLTRKNTNNMVLCFIKELKNSKYNYKRYC